MRTLLLPVYLFILAMPVLSGCESATTDADAQDPQDAPPEAVVNLEPPADSAALVSHLEQLVVSAGEAANAHGLQDTSYPGVVIKTAPQMIYFNPESNQVVAPRWEAYPDAFHNQFIDVFAGGDAELGERIFRLSFNQFFVFHETMHWVQWRSERGPLDSFYELEQEANDLVVAFLTTLPHAESFLTEYRALVDDILSRLEDPTPEGEDPATYFDANYQQLGQQPEKYGYFQFTFVDDALERQDELDFRTIVGKLITNE